MFRGKVDYTDDYRVLLHDGRISHVHAIGHPMLDETGEVVEYVAAVADVTNRKRAKEERNRLHRLEADLGRIDCITTMGELTASLAHELKQRITGCCHGRHDLHLADSRASEYGRSVRSWLEGCYSRNPRCRNQHSDPLNVHEE